jgi:uncharacterized protein (TIGR03435 family)
VEGIVRYFATLTIVTLAAIASPAQTVQPEFDVASVKPALPGRSLNEVVGPMIHPRPGQWRMLDLTLHNIILLAYPELRFQKLLVGEPDWVADARFDVDARMSPTATHDEVMQMQRHLLESRFALRTHTEKRSVDVYALTVAKPGTLGPGLTPARPVCVKWRMTGGAVPPECDLYGHAGIPGAMMTSVASISDLIAAITIPVPGQVQRAIDRPVVDRTGLEGFFQIIGPSPMVPPGRDIASFFTLIEEQLGLKLIPVREMMDVLVIDHIERPSEN